MRTFVLCWLVVFLLGASGQAVGQQIQPPAPPNPPAGTAYANSDQNLKGYVNNVLGLIFNVIGDNIKLSSGVWVWAPPGNYHVTIRKTRFDYVPGVGLRYLGHVEETGVINVPQPVNRWTWVPSPVNHSVTSLNTHRLLITVTLRNPQNEIVHPFGYHGDFRTPTGPTIPIGTEVGN